ncbi:hypothetical protein [Pseudomonas glycinae]|uniref:Uncharacterized protein n=1 Tax=Pseudomonas glycinae TaxID=1785145 RepID=A0ABM6QI44_9PSED|nr:hypothetical protein [Pseudomonas glycinae]AUG97624.1 hypothetical protein AWU82_29880 [Pseudomonas glycinae]
MGVWYYINGGNGVTLNNVTITIKVAAGGGGGWDKIGCVLRQCRWWHFEGLGDQDGEHRRYGRS